MKKGIGLINVRNIKYAKRKIITSKKSHERIRYW
jgi:hypothetical protein